MISDAARAGLEPGDVEMGFNRVSAVGNPDKSMAFVDLVTLCAAEGVHRSELAIFRAPFTDHLDPETGQGQVHPDYVYGAHAIEVSVDTDTGEVTILKSIAAHDVGRAINPRLIEGQIEGGVAMGLGYALMEDVVVDQGYIRNTGLQNYLIPTSLDVPDIKPIILEVNNKYGPYGAKGIGEMPNIPATPAILNAIANACGARVRSLPADPERVFRALQEAGGSPED